MITTKFYLDSRATKDGAAAPLKISITKNRQVSYLSTSIRILPSDWNSASLKAKSPAVQLSADLKKADVDTILIDLQRQRKLDGLNARQVRDMVLEQLTPEEVGPAKLMPAFMEFASTRRKPRTREIYQATIDRIREFDHKADSLTFEDIEIGWLDRFDSFLAKTSPKKNSRNIHFRNIKAVFHDARRRRITTCDPFIDYSIRPEPTAHRDLSVEQLRILFNADVKPWQQKYVDFFKISFMLIGMNTEDLLHATEISGGRIEYKRAKTDKPYSIKVEPECMELIEKYRGKKYLLNILDTYSKTRYWTSKVNNELQAIANVLGLPKISMYWARHSWSTMCSDLDIPDATNSKAMGHGKKTVTDTYINFDRAKIDRANRQVMDFVLYGKKPMTIHDILNLNIEEIRRRMADGA